MVKKQSESVRYVPTQAFVCVDKAGAKRHFSPDYKQGDGTLGYTLEQLDGVYKRTVDALFETVSVTGVRVRVDKVEQATAAPGELR